MKLGNVQTLPWYTRMGVFAGLALVLYGAFYYFVTSGTRAETKALMDQVEDLKRQNANAQIAEQRLNEFRAAFKARQQEYDDLKALLPEQRELTNVLQGVQDRARSSNLSLARFAPKDDVQEEFYSAKPIEVSVRSSFANLRSFYDQMAKYQRIVSITDFKINRLSDQEFEPSRTVNTTFIMKAYYATPDNMKSVPKPAAPGAPASAQTPGAQSAAPAAK
jgi:type IV pilus assembly protein PilO